MRDVDLVGAMDPSVRREVLQETPSGLLQEAEDERLCPPLSHLLGRSPGVVWFGHAV